LQIWKASARASFVVGLLGKIVGMEGGSIKLQIENCMPSMNLFICPSNVRKMPYSGKRPNSCWLFSLYSVIHQSKMPAVYRGSVYIISPMMIISRQFVRDEHHGNRQIDGRSIEYKIKDASTQSLLFVVHNLHDS